MKTYIVHKVALKSREEEEQMYQEDRSPEHSKITPEASVHAGVSPHLRVWVTVSLCVLVSNFVSKAVLAM